MVQSKSGILYQKIESRMLMNYEFMDTNSQTHPFRKADKWLGVFQYIYIRNETEILWVAQQQGNVYRWTQSGSQKVQYKRCFSQSLALLKHINITSSKRRSTRRRDICCCCSPKPETDFSPYFYKMLLVSLLLQWFLSRGMLGVL